VGGCNLTEHSVAGGLGADVLSTQSTSEPDVVKGMRESIGRDSRLVFSDERTVQVERCFEVLTRV
jgi:hypothetical protein